MEKYLISLDTDRILTIKKVNDDYYTTIEASLNWSDDMIECLAKDYKEPIPVSNRFELLDIR